MVETFDGLLWCQECGLPMLIDGKGNYVHINELSRERLSLLVRDVSVADRLADWVINLDGKCPDCGKVTKPFIGITKEEFIRHTRTKQEADDFANVLITFLTGSE